MLAKKYILRDKKVFEALKFKGQKVKIGPFLLSFFKDNSLKSHHLFGIIISQKAITKACLRNQVKRKIRALLSQYKNTEKEKRFLDLVVVVLAEPQKEDYQSLNLFFKKFFL